MAEHYWCALYSWHLHLLSKRISPLTARIPFPSHSLGPLKDLRNKMCTYHCGIVLETGKPKYFLHMLGINLFYQ